MKYSNYLFFVADIHYHKNYLEYIKEPMNDLITQLKEKKPLITVIGGDYFHKRLSAEEETYNIAISNIIEMSKYTKHLIFIRGTYSHDYNTLDILNNLKKIQNNIYYFDKAEHIILENKRILLLPEEYPIDPISYYKPFFENKKYDFIFGHGDIKGAILHSGIENSLLKGFKFDLELLSNISKWTFFGHIHKQQFLKYNVGYPGSLARTRHGENEDKGFFILNMDNNEVFFKIVNTFEFRTIIINNEEDLEKYKKYLNDTNINVNIKLDRNVSFLKEEIKNLSVNNDIIFSNIKEEENNNELKFLDIEKLSILEQYSLILEKDFEEKKIPKKYNNFLNEESIKNKVNLIIKKLTL